MGIVHHKIHPDPIVLAKDAFRGNRFALTLGAKYLGAKDLLVGEALCARLIAEDASFVWSVGEQSIEALSMKLFKWLIATSVFGDPPGRRNHPQFQSS